ncbi:hypothetical protein [Halovivax sp.]|uniref:hypothetical protein n=1 Tax=Halovivax sp. TaxID=1935978 RepID=UPI0025B7BBC2|nr:hypothetical protein [Halovivax sp.]
MTDEAPPRAPVGADRTVVTDGGWRVEPDDMPAVPDEWRLPQVTDDDIAAYEAATANEEPWTRGARVVWTRRARARTRRFPDEPDTNVDRLPIPPWISVPEWHDAMWEQYEKQDRALGDGRGGETHSRGPREVLGTQSGRSDAEYFVLHDPDVAEENLVGEDPVHLWLGVENLALTREWYERGNATKLERGTTGCFVHVEVCIADRGRRGPNTGQHAFHQYWDLANAYVAASLEAQQFLTVTAHREVDRGFRDGHDDPTDLNLELFYRLISRSLLYGDVDCAAEGFGFPATFGIAPARFETENRQGDVNEFVPYHLGRIPRADQYGPVRTRGPEDDDSAYDPHHVAHHSKGRWGWLYERGELPAERTCGGGRWPADATTPPDPI